MARTLYSKDEFKEILMRGRKFFVYSLWIAGTCFYVGKGTRPLKSYSLRPFAHEKDARRGNSPKDRFIRKALRAGLAIEYGFEFDSNHEHHVYFHEQVLMDAHGKRKDGGTLFNVADGGQGITGHKLSAKTRAKMSSSRTGMQMDEKWCRAISEGRFKSPLIRRRGVVVEGKEFPSIAEASRTLNIEISKLHRWLRSKKHDAHYLD